MSWQLALLNLWLRLVEKRHLARETDFARARSRLERQVPLFRMPPGASPTQAPLEHAGRSVAALRLPAREGARVLLWLHGGAYCIGSPRTHAAMVAALAERLGAGAVLPDYRLAPEHPFPAALEDARTAWEALLAEGHAPGRLLLGGDSAGGGLALALLHELIAGGRPLPSAVATFCPWTDLTRSGETLRTLARRDVLVPVERFAEIRDAYLAGADPADPRASPLFGRFEGAPPVFIQASEAEVLLDDARRLAACLRAQGVAATLDLWRATPHVWQLYQGRLPEADAALDRAAAFLVAIVGRAAGTSPRVGLRRSADPTRNSHSEIPG